jgi:signal peptidase I
MAAQKKVRRAPEEMSLGERAWEWVKSLAVIIVLFLVIRTFLVQTFVITSGSMEDTLEVGDFLLISKAAYGAVIPGTEARLPGYRDPQRGDIIVFRAEHEPNMDLVKRLIALPGDTVAMVGGVLHLNGEPQVEPYVRPGPDAQDASHPAFNWQREFLAEPPADGVYRPTLHNWGPIVVPENRYFALGDNREQSLDSRFWGFVEAPKVKGRAVFLYWSYDGEALKPLPWLTAVRWERIGDRVR